MGKMNLRGRTILVTGATRGLGRALSLTLAIQEGANLILVGRDEARLNDLAGEIAQSSSAGTRIVVKDLLKEDSAHSLFDETKQEDVFGLVNNAGLTYYGPTQAAALQQFTSILEVDLRRVVELTLLFFEAMKAKSRGFILNVTSLAAFLPIPYQSVYSAAKAATQVFSECLAQENRGTPVLVATFAPSGMYTDMIERAGLRRHMETHRFSYIDTERAAREIIRGLKRGKRLIIPGVFNRLLYHLVDFVPRRVLLRSAERIFRYETYRVSESE
jgi:short-subunit dehydrogenase